MRFLFENREKGEGFGGRAAAAIRATLDPARTSAEIARRVQDLSQAGEINRREKPALAPPDQADERARLR